MTRTICGWMVALACAGGLAVVQRVTAKEDAKAKPADAKPADGKSADGKKSEHKPTSLFDGKSLGKWSKSKFVSQGEVEVKDGAIVIGVGEGGSGVTWTGDFPTINYELSLDAQRVDGSDFFCGLTFPVERKKGDKQFCSLICGGWGGGVVGISSIDGFDASENRTTTYKEFKTGQWYKIRLRVTTEKIEAWIDKDKVVDFDSGDKKLTIRIEVEDSKPLGIATWRTTGAIRNVQVQSVDKPDTPVEKE